MEVLVGPTFTIDVPSPPAYVVPAARPPQDKHQMVVAPASLLSEEEEAAGSPERVQIPRGIGSGSSEEENSSESSSSIGAPDESEEEEDEDSSVVSSSKAGLGSLESLEDSLPIKRGLSNHFCGKSKSFVNLSDMSSVGSAKDLEKPENPFNKRRRILMANKWSKRSSFYSWHNPKSMPLLALNEDEQEENEDNQGPDEESPSSSSSSPPHRHPGEEKEKLFLSPKAQGRNFKFNNASFKSHSCFSLADLEHQ